MPRPYLCVAIVAALGSCGPSPLPPWQEADGYRWRELIVSGRSAPGFTSVSTRRAGVDLVNAVTEARLLENRHRSHGSGVTIGDINGDGLPDIYLGSIDGPNALYRNLGGWRFENVTDVAGVAAANRETTGVLFADVDGDSDLDLLVAALGSTTSLFLNNGSGVFEERVSEAGFSTERGSTTMTMADIDNDGDLDLYVTNYKTASVTDLYPPAQRAYSVVVTRIGDSAFINPEHREHYRIRNRDGEWLREGRAEADVLYLNDGNGVFEATSFLDGRFLDENGHPLRDPPDFFGLAARFYDVDDDGDPDLYVCNDFFDPDHLWINDGSGRFQLVDPLALRHTSQSTMAVDFADIDRDGDTDFFQVDMLDRVDARRKNQIAMHSTRADLPGRINTRPQIQRNSLFLNRSDGTFAQVGDAAGVTASDWSWGTAFLDVELDGYEDILITNGHPWDVNDQDTRERLAAGAGVPWNREVLEFPPYRSGNVLFHNNGDGTFEDVSESWGFDQGEDVSHGLAYGDLDGDGDQDVIVTRLDDPPLLLRNNATAPRIAVRLVGDAPNTGAVGARVRLVNSDGFSQQREVTSGGLYLSGSDHALTFAAVGDSSWLEITWRNGHVARFDHVRPNHEYQITQAGFAGAPRAVEEALPPYFDDVSDLIDHEHSEEPYDDFLRQPLLPAKLSQSGPGVAWNDIDRDGDDDLVIGSGGGGNLAVYENRNGNFRRIDTGPGPAFDLTGIVFLPLANGTQIVIGQSSYESADRASAFALPNVTGWTARPGLTVQRGLNLTAGDASSVGPLAAADVDGDGDLDLFVGGRVLPGGYPLPATSRLLKNDGASSFSRDETNAAVFENIGMVSGAVFTDLDNDGDPDLALALDWGPITIFRNEDGRFRNVSTEMGVRLSGQWNGISAGDFNEDGRMDLVVTGIGDNSKYGPINGNPVSLYFGDFDRNGRLDILEGRFVDSGIRPLNRLTRLMIALPGIRQRAPTFDAYSTMSISDLVGLDSDSIPSVLMTTSAHTLLLNNGGRFQINPLPVEAQRAPAHHAAVADYNGDGHEDLFLSQNFYPAELGTARSDAGRGLWLTGDGAGNFEAFESGSGIAAYGDQRGAAVADFDGDARVDLAVSQNGAKTRLFRNRRGRPGLRVRFRGPVGNPDGVGARLRIIYDNGSGPVREIHMGAGYWSQAGSIPVMGLAPDRVARFLEVKWPDGQVERIPVDAAQTEVLVRR